jgi:hypothetical protein
MKQVREITLEANPDDLTPEYTRMLATLPFNRISMGIQTFDDTTLQLLKRHHRPQRQPQHTCPFKVGIARLAQDEDSRMVNCVYTESIYIVRKAIP